MPGKYEGIEPRVTSLERDMAALTSTVTTLATTVKEGFATEAKARQLFQGELHDEIREIGRKTEQAGKPNYNALALILSSIVLVGGWYVSSQTNPIAEALRAEKDARIAAVQAETSAREQSDIVSKTDRDRNSEKISELASSVVSNTPEGRAIFMQRIEEMGNRITRLETINEFCRRSN